MNIPMFSEQDIPYNILNQFGLTEEMISDLPEHSLRAIYAGQRSPVLPITVEGENGESVSCRTRFCLIRNEEDEVDMVFIPQLIESDLSSFSPEKQEILKKGLAVTDLMATSEGREVMAFHQIDRETSQVLSVPTPVIGRNIQIIADNLHLTPTEMSCLSNGQPLTLSMNDNSMTIGVDLNETTGLRANNGDEKLWLQNPKRDWDKYNFGLYGCWTMDDEGNLDYVNEANYTDEMWSELKKNSQARAQSQAHKM